MHADSVIGSARQQVWNLFLKTGQTSKKHDLPATGQAIFNAIYLEINEKERRAKKIERIYKTIEVV
jgi:calcineurin-like phosphoesterase